MELVKPDPLYIDGYPHYTLSSYEAPDVEVRIPYVCEEDIVLGLEHELELAGGDMSYLEDGDWLRNRFNGIDNEEELREMVAEKLVSHDGELARGQKYTGGLEVLAERLNERVSDNALDIAHMSVIHELAEKFEMTDKPVELLIERMEMTEDDFYQLIDEMAESSAKNEAALSAWADHYGLDVKDEDIPRILGVNDVQAQDFMEYMMSNYDWVAVRQLALREIALRDLAAKCNCTYVQETAEEAQERIAKRRKMMKEDEEEEARFKRPHLKLV